MHPTTLHRTKTDLGVADVPSTTASPAGAFSQPDANSLLVTFMQATNAAPLVQLADNASTADVTVQMARAGVVSLQVTANNHPLVEPFECTVPPGFSVYVYLGIVASPAVGAERVNIYVTPYNT